MTCRILSGDIGRPSWSFLPIENLEQVEVIKGASSVLYGSAALSGVINVRTVYPRLEPRTRALRVLRVLGYTGPQAREVVGRQSSVVRGCQLQSRAAVRSVRSGDRWHGLQRLRIRGSGTRATRYARGGPPAGRARRLREQGPLQFRHALAEQEGEGTELRPGRATHEDLTSTILLWDNTSDGSSRSFPARSR